MFFSICVAVTFKIASAIVSAVNCVSVAKTSATGMEVVSDSFCALLRKSRLNSRRQLLSKIARKMHRPSKRRTS